MKACPPREEIRTPNQPNGVVGGSASNPLRLRVGTQLVSGVANAQRCHTGASSEPCDLAVSRSARRLHLLGSRASASRLPGSARPTDGGTRPAGGNARDFYAAELPCVTRGSERDEQDGRSCDRQLGRILPAPSRPVGRDADADTTGAHVVGRSAPSGSNPRGAATSDVSLLNVFGGLVVLAIIFYVGFCR